MTFRHWDIKELKQLYNLGIIRLELLLEQKLHHIVNFLDCLIDQTLLQVLERFKCGVFQSCWCIVSFESFGKTVVNLHNQPVLINV